MESDHVDFNDLEQSQPQVDFLAEENLIQIEPQIISPKADNELF